MASSERPSALSPQVAVCLTTLAALSPLALQWKYSLEPLLCAGMICVSGLVVCWLDYHFTQGKTKSGTLANLPSCGQVRLASTLYRSMLVIGVLEILFSFGLVLHQNDSNYQLQHLYAIAFFVCALTWQRYKLDHMPKSVDKLLRLLLIGLGDGKIMISYAWESRTTRKPIWHLPRKVATLLPENCVWLDIKKLIPGSNTKLSTSLAARNAKLRVVFLSDAYFLSDNCMLEWNEIIIQDPDSFVMMPVTPEFDFGRWENKLKGRSWSELHVLPYVHPNALDAGFLLRQLVGPQRRVLCRMLAHSTPAINEGWLTTAEVLAGERSGLFGIVRKWPSIILGALCTGLVASCFTNYSYIQELSATSNTATASEPVKLWLSQLLACLIYPAAVWGLVLISLVLQLQFGSFTFGVWKFWSDSMYVLVILRKLKLIPQVATFASPAVRKHHPDLFAFLEETSVIRMTDDGEEASFLCIGIEEYFGTQRPPTPSNARAKEGFAVKQMCYTNRSFREILPLLDGHPEVMASLIKQQGFPTEEQLLVQLLLAATGCEEDGIRCGKNNFEDTVKEELADANAQASISALESQSVRSLVLSLLMRMRWHLQNKVLLGPGLLGLTCVGVGHIFHVFDSVTLATLAEVFGIVIILVSPVIGSYLVMLL